MFLLPNNFCAGCGTDTHEGAPAGMYNGHTCGQKPKYCVGCGERFKDCDCLVTGMTRGIHRPSMVFFSGEAVR